MNTFSKIKNWNDASELAADLLDVKQNSEGNEEEAFMAGWVNAADMIDDGELDSYNDGEVMRVVFYEFDNLGYTR